MVLSSSWVIFPPVENQMTEVGKPWPHCFGSVSSRSNREFILPRSIDEDEEAHRLRWETELMFSQEKDIFQIQKRESQGENVMVNSRSGKSSSCKRSGYCIVKYYAVRIFGGYNRP